jgi:redox-regulated HSP33 family molecular chaperone
VLTNEQFQDAKKYENERNYEKKCDYCDSIYKFACLRKVQLFNEWLNIAFDEQ